MVIRKGCREIGSLFNFEQPEFLQPPEDRYYIYASGAFERNKPRQKNYLFSLSLLAAFPYLCRPKSVFADSSRTMQDVHWDKSN